MGWFLNGQDLGYRHRVAEIEIVTLTRKSSDPLGKTLLSVPIILGYAGPDCSDSRVRAVLLMLLTAPTTNMPLNWRFRFLMSLRQTLRKK